MAVKPKVLIPRYYRYSRNLQKRSGCLEPDTNFCRPRQRFVVLLDSLSQIQGTPRSGDQLKGEGVEIDSKLTW